MLLRTQGDNEAADLPATLDMPTIGSAMSSWRSTRRARSQSSSSPSVTSSATATQRLSSLKPVSVSVSRPPSGCFKPTPSGHSPTNIAERPFAFTMEDCSNEKISLAVAIVQARRKAGQFPKGLFVESLSSQRTASPAGGKSPPREGGLQELEEQGHEGRTDPAPSQLVGDGGAPNEKAFGAPVAVVHEGASLQNVDGETSSSNRKARDDVGGKMLGRKWAIQKRPSESTQNFRRSGFSPCPNSCCLLVCE